MVAKWPGVIQPGTIVNDIMAAEDWLPTLVAAAGEPQVKEKLLTGYKAGEKTFKNHLDGYNFMPYFKGEIPAPRHEFFYFSDNADLMAVRYGTFKDYPPSQVSGSLSVEKALQLLQTGSRGSGT